VCVFVRLASCLGRVDVLVRVAAFVVCVMVCASPGGSRVLFFAGWWVLSLGVNDSAKRKKERKKRQ
jgi:hypothetical protein